MAENLQISFDTNHIDAELKKTKECILNGSTFYINNPNNTDTFDYENLDQSIKYKCKIIGETYSYFGILSSDLTREVFGVNTYPRKDMYMGHWKKNTKNGVGIYEFKVENAPEEEFYFGQWENGKKKGFGIYLWKHSDAKVTNLKEANYDAFLGEFDNDQCKKGVLVKWALKENVKLDDNYILYHGAISENGMKVDTEAALLENDNCFFGEFKNDEMVRGVVVTFALKEGTSKVESSYRFVLTNPEDDDYAFETKPEETKQYEVDADKYKRRRDYINYPVFLQKLYDEYLQLKTKSEDLEILSTFIDSPFFETLDGFMKFPGRYNFTTEEIDYLLEKKP